jgi:quinol monooxygenase YgiN
MIVISVTMTIKLEAREDALRAMAEMARITRGEAGCHAYYFSMDLDEPNTIYLFEHWQDMDSLKAHTQAPHYKSFISSFPAMRAGPTQVVKFEATSAETL